MPEHPLSLRCSVTSATGASSGAGAAGAGVGQAVLRGLPGAGLPLGQGRAGVPALGGPAAAAEQLAFDVPEALPVVKPVERGERG